ncbi:hypothetical protein NP493_2964g00003 [Ridgeia piscesae]|uniref:Uncharacterized protein n=1 Tax=Ridgeia piscesae TaxID=27915 RepID=A0AAD9MXY6_RIDPI|nr:hypothetical protein NP493_2964g00003 [Ridgeia piscesae]
MEARRRQSVQQTAPTNPNAWEVGYVPKTNKNTSFVNIYKKGDRTVYGNCRRISLLSITGKILATILLNRLST